VLNRLCLVSFGDRAEWYAEAHLAILTAVGRIPPPCEVVIATDRPERYRWFGDRVRVEQLTPERIEQWSGPQRFVWRVVLEAIAQIARRAPIANLLYVDVDTLARRPLDDLFALLQSGDVFLDKRESRLCRRREGDHRRLWKQVRGRMFLEFRIDEGTEIWNSGVVALGADNLHLVEKSLALCDAMTAAGVQNRLVEQLAQSVILQSTGRLREAAPWIDHYWGNKAAYDAAVHEQLATILVRGMSVDEAIEYVREHPIRGPLRAKPRWWHRYRRFTGAET
jgi:muconolactone delta-isomerase